MKDIFKTFFWIMTILMLLWVACQEEPAEENVSIMIASARLASPPIIPFPSIGDLWLNTWADDDNIYITWGDGCGPGQVYGDPYVEEFGTDAGVAVLKGPVPDFTNCTSPFDCIRSIHVPDGGTGWGDSLTGDDKPSSILFYNGRLYFAGHTPLGDPDYGYVAYSDDYGLHWTEVPNSPWTRANNSVYRIIMFINMGKNYELNTDGYVYALGIGTEWGWSAQTVFLCRVPRDSIINYAAYEYWTQNDADNTPIWTENEADAQPLEDIYAGTLGSAMYHAGAQHYLFFTVAGGLFAAPRPWGPWEAIEFLDSEYDTLWQGGYMPGIISKDAGPDYFYFTLAGQDQVIGYYCHIGKIELQLLEIID